MGRGKGQREGVDGRGRGNGRRVGAEGRGGGKGQKDRAEGMSRGKGQTASSIHNLDRLFIKRHIELCHRLHKACLLQLISNQHSDVHVGLSALKQHVHIVI